MVSSLMLGVQQVEANVGTPNADLRLLEGINGIACKLGGSKMHRKFQLSVRLGRNRVLTAPGWDKFGQRVPSLWVLVYLTTHHFQSLPAKQILQNPNLHKPPTVRPCPIWPVTLPAFFRLVPVPLPSRSLLLSTFRAHHS